MNKRYLLLLSCAAVVSPALAQTHPCSEVATPVDRLACYDEAFPPSTAIQDSVRRQAEEDFGKPLLARDAARFGQPVEVADPNRIESSVAKVVYANGRRTVTLENGQVWSQSDTSGTGHVVAGDTVTIRKGALGSYMLLTPAGVGIRVRRTR